MNCISTPSRALGIRWLLAAIVVTIVVSTFWTGSVHASGDRPGGLESNPPSLPLQQEAEDSDPEANLPYMFAVFIITWAVFFGYVFVMSRRQRDLQRELSALRMALAEKERHSEEKEDR